MLNALGCLASPQVVDSGKHTSSVGYGSYLPTPCDVLDIPDIPNRHFFVDTLTERSLALQAPLDVQASFSVQLHTRRHLVS